MPLARMLAAFGEPSVDCPACKYARRPLTHGSALEFSHRPDHAFFDRAVDFVMDAVEGVLVERQAKGSQSIQRAEPPKPPTG
jgi:hypothetical protein